MPIYTDQTGRRVEIGDSPQRIVSLVPSQTELLFDLGLNETVVGVTRFCVHPVAKTKNSTVVGGTKNPDLSLIGALRPDLIIANKEENRKEDIEALERNFPVWVSDVSTLPEAMGMIREVGRIVDKESTALWIANRVEERFAALADELSPQNGTQKKAAYLIWRNPWMAAGQGTFINSMLPYAGLGNVFADRPRYPESTLEELALLQPDVIFLSSEPFPFTEKHLAEIQSFCPNSRVRLIDGALFSWYGSRLLRTPAYLRATRSTLNL